MSSPLLARILGPNPPPFALLYRPEASGPGILDVIVGETATVATLAELRASGAKAATAPAAGSGARHEVLALVPYRQIAERGFAAPEEDTPLVAMTVTDQEHVSLVEALSRIPDLPIELDGGAFDISDEEYADTVRRVISDEIGEGKGANFVIKRSWSTAIREYSTGHALTLFRRLLERESGAYWTFVVHTGERTLVGASPERHVSLREGTAVMNPISGTYRYPAAGPSLPEVMDFLADAKEVDELYMVVDEELKMMARICEGGARVDGPYLKEMARLAHTEYFIEGRSGHTPEEILRETLFAPTVTGSPLESAAAVIAEYEPQGRGYYSGVLALIGHDEQGGHALDSSILIRTADIGAGGEVKIGVGATLVRHSDPWSEVAETKAKAAGLLAALESQGSRARFASHPDVRAALQDRNRTIADYWLKEERDRAAVDPALAGRRVLVVDAEDTFTAMIARQLVSLGLDVTVRRFDQAYSFDGYDLVVMGPGPGDPRDSAHPKIDHLRTAVRTLLDERRPFLAICLSHQVLSTTLGFELVRRSEPNQGVQKEIDFFGRPERVGFYNTFAARSAVDSAIIPGIGLVDISRDPETDEVHALRGPYFASMQFHAESVLTLGGPRITGELLASLTARMLAA
ncbi:anthranilate synthase family protein [Streptomyces sp. H34-S4]|uniref:anthranilate synthase family protein n=1 Tax=Streptomyces sp. H34-S4 TaxID=2996463 RepID=UPI00226E5440|nr:anthranilate synthase family protein [Streptomyces sp. H34-S4]MCY0936772.1 anthranilate synthase family protein [Streptomyces sp. H34-S4]